MSVLLSCIFQTCCKKKHVALGLTIVSLSCPSSTGSLLSRGWIETFSMLPHKSVIIYTKQSQCKKPPPTLTENTRTAWYPGNEQSTPSVGKNYNWWGCLCLPRGYQSLIDADRWPHRLLAFDWITSEFLWAVFRSTQWDHWIFSTVSSWGVCVSQWSWQHS